MKIVFDAPNIVLTHAYSYSRSNFGYCILRMDEQVSYYW